MEPAQVTDCAQHAERERREGGVTFSPFWQRAPSDHRPKLLREIGTRPNSAGVCGKDLILERSNPGTARREVTGAGTVAQDALQELSRKSTHRAKEDPIIRKRRDRSPEQ